MLMYQPDRMADWDGWRSEKGIESSSMEAPSVISPYDNDLAKAAERCFDRDTGKPIPANMLKSYRSALSQYHLRPESKFLNADYLDSGLVRRRHVKVSGIVYIGKEANRWEEQSHLGIDPEAEIAYGTAPADYIGDLARIRRAVDDHGMSSFARVAGISRQHMDAVLCGHAIPSNKMMARLRLAATKLDVMSVADASEARALFGQIRTIGVRRFAALAGIDAGHLTRLTGGERRLTAPMLEKLRSAVAARREDY